MTMGSAAMFSGKLQMPRYAKSRSEAISSALNEDKDTLRRSLANCGKSLRRKLFLASYDIMSVNLSSRPVYQLYQLLDFLFLAAFPLNRIYNYSTSALQYWDPNAATDGTDAAIAAAAAAAANATAVGNSTASTAPVPSAGQMIAPFLQYMLPTDMMFTSLNYETDRTVAFCMSAFVMLVTGIVVALIATRSTKHLGTESPERKLLNKAVGLVLAMTYHLLFVPICTFISRFLICEQALEA